MPRTGTADREPPSRPRLDFVYGRRGDADLVIVAHGGQENSYAHPHARRPAALRMWPFVHAAHKGAPDAAVAFVRYRFRGWNGEHSHPLADLRTVLTDLPLGVRRVVLVGHSMGGRAVVHCVSDPRVKGVLALSPWLPDTDPIPGLSPAADPDALLVTAHGTRDRITSPRATSAYVRRFRESGRSAAEFRVHGDNHTLLDRHGDWDELVTRFVMFAITGQVDHVIAHALTADPGHAPDELPHWSDRRGSTRAVVSIARARAKAPRPTSIVGE